jgi:glycosyltransferase involved in cell wall biosynthesis
MLQLVQRLDRGLFEPMVVFTQPGPILDFARQIGVPTCVVPLRSAFFYSAHVPIRLRMLVLFVLHFRPTVQRVQELVQCEQPALLHLNTSVLIPAAVGVKREGVPLVWHVREVPGPHPRLRRWQTGVISRLADCIVANSDFVRQAFPPDANVTVIHNALDLSRFCIDESKARTCIRGEFGLPSLAPVVGMIGSVQVVKGHDLLVQAARQVVQDVPHVRFLIVAGGVGAAYARSWKGRLKRAVDWPLDNLQRMRRQITAAGLQEHFVFTGYRSDIPEVMAAIDVLAFLPQAAEGFGRPLIEAMAMGRPVVATDIGPTREILGDNAGILVTPGDADQVASALTILLRDAALRQGLGEAGRQRVAARFALDKAVQAIHSLYSDVLGDGLLDGGVKPSLRHPKDVATTRV